jgi:hypothetical protein
MQLVRAVLEEIGKSDLALPGDLDGAHVTVDLPRVVTAMYGDCTFDVEEARREGYDPDDPSIPRLSDCTTCTNAQPGGQRPPGLDIAKIGEAFLQILGMSAEELPVSARTSTGRRRWCFHFRMYADLMR